jgi:hypothetical protein
MTDEELQHLRQLRALTIRRKNELENMQARMGPRTPAETVIEIRECDESIARIDAKLLQVSVPQDVALATGPDASIDVLRHAVKQLSDQVGTIWRWTEKVLIEIREDNRDWQRVQDAARREGQQRRMLIDLAIFLMIAALTWLIFTRGT